MKDIQIAQLVQEKRRFFLNSWILPIGEASAVEGLQSTGLHRLVNKIIALARDCVYFLPLLPMSQFTVGKQGGLGIFSFFLVSGFYA